MVLISLIRKDFPVREWNKCSLMGVFAGTVGHVTGVKRSDMSFVIHE